MNVREAFVRLNEIVMAAGMTKPDTILLGVYHDDPATTPEEKLRSDAAITVPEKTKLPQGLSELVIPAGRESIGNLGDFVLHVFDHAKRVGAVALQNDAGNHFAFAVEFGKTAAFIGTKLDLRYIRQPDGNAVF